MNLDNSYVLVLNSGWMPIGVKRLKEAMTAVFENKEWQLVQIDRSTDNPCIQPVSWLEWLELEANDSTGFINTIRGPIRIPTVIITKNYSKVIYRTLKPNKRGIYDRDKGICQYTGKKLTRTNCSIDHLVPKSKGGRNTWDNMVLCDKEINNKKGSKLPEDFYIKTISKPKSPRPLPVADLISKTHKDWDYFIT